MQNCPQVYGTSPAIQDYQSGFLSFNIAIAVIESITGMSWEQMVQDEVFTPLGNIIMVFLIFCPFYHIYIYIKNLRLGKIVNVLF